MWECLFRGFYACACKDGRELKWFSISRVQNIAVHCAIEWFRFNILVSERWCAILNLKF